MNNHLEEAVAALRRGGVVAFPTETVWGLGVEADDKAAVGRLLALKGSPPNRPITVHFGPNVDMGDWARFPRGARALADAFWPGPLTLVLPWRSRTPGFVTGGNEGVGLRVPNHPVAEAFLDAFGEGVAATSANLAGQPPSTNARAVREHLGEHVDVLLDGDPPCAGLASTVLSLLATPRILRQGFLSREELQDVLGAHIEV